MKKAFLLFVLFAAMVSCGKGDEPKPDPTPNPPSQNDPNDPDDPDNPNDPEKPNESVNISLSTSSLSFYSYGGALATMITCPEGKTWTLSGGESWCVPNWTSGPNGAFLVFTIEDYTGTEDRNATYTFTCDGQTATLKVTQQAGKTISIHVATEGSLQSILKEQAWNIFGNDNISLLDIRNLKITGNVNDDDCRTIASMFYLRNLDISETTLTEVNALSGAKFKNIILPKNLKKIRRGAFENSALQAIEIPANVETIEDAVFAWCSALTNVTFEQGSQLKTIGEEGITSRGGAFCVCPSLTSIEIPASVKYIGSQTFSQCTALTTVNFESGSKLMEIDAFAFSHSGLQSIEIPRSVETIGMGAFKECTDLATVTFEKGSQLKKIEGNSSGYDFDGTFYDCTSLTSIQIPASVEKIEGSAFGGCTALTTVTFEKGSQLKTIGESWFSSSYYKGTFSDCTSLTSIEIPASVETIESSTFEGCKALTTVTFEKGSQLKTIGQRAFIRSMSLQSIEIPASVETIESSTFEGCKALTIVTFEQGSQLNAIDYGAFSGCLSLKTIDMSTCTKVKTIGLSVIYECHSLQTFKLGTRTPPNVSSYLGSIPATATLQVPANSISSYRTARGWKDFPHITSLD